jgi:hypothetical protein
MRCLHAHLENDWRPATSLYGRIVCHLTGNHVWDHNRFGDARQCHCCGRQERQGVISGGVGMVCETRQWMGEFRG